MAATPTPTANPQGFVPTLKAIFTAFGADKATTLAAAIAFSTIFSIAPLLIIIIAIAGAVIGHHAVVEDQIVAMISHNGGSSTGATVRRLIDANFNRPRQGRIAQIIAWVAFAFTASNLFGSLQGALNSVWNVEGTTAGFKQLVRDRLVSFLMIIVVLFILMGTFVANSAIAFVGTHFLSLIPYGQNPVVLAAIAQAVNFVLVTSVFALIFKVLPDVNVRWRDVGVGAAFTGVLFIVGEAVIAIYLARAGVGSAYGAAGSILVALLWIYYSALILLLGAEFTKVTARHAALIMPSLVREVNEHPAGADPRREHRDFNASAADSAPSASAPASATTP